MTGLSLSGGGLVICFIWLDSLASAAGESSRVVFTNVNVKTTLYVCESLKDLATMEELLKDWLEEATDTDNRSDSRDNSKEDVQTERGAEIIV